MKIKHSELRNLILEACGCQPVRHGGTGIESMNPMDAFITGLMMGQSGELDDLVQGAYAGGDNLENPIDYAMMTAGESNAGPHSLMALEEQQEFVSSEEIEDALLSVLSVEGGAAGISALRSGISDLAVPDNFDLESFLSNSGKIDQHPDGDYVAGKVAVTSENYELPERQNLGPSFVDVQPMMIGKPLIDTTGLSQADIWARMAGIKRDK